MRPVSKNSESDDIGSLDWKEHIVRVVSLSAKVPPSPVLLKQVPKQPTDNYVQMEMNPFRPNRPMYDIMHSRLDN